MIEGIGEALVRTCAIAVARGVTGGQEQADDDEGGGR